MAPIVLDPSTSDEGDGAAREQLATRFIPLARALALRYRRGNEPFDDLFQVACLGLVKAINRFDAARGSSFQAYAAPTIAGELKRHFRDRVMPIHLPRGLKEDVLEVSEAASELTAELDRKPSVTELAGRVEMSEEQVADAMQASGALRTLSLDGPATVAAIDPPPLAETVGAVDQRLETAEARTVLWRAFRVLDQRERTIVNLRFVSDLTQAQIAERVGVSQVHVSRILRRALGKLREVVGDREQLEDAA